MSETETQEPVETPVEPQEPQEEPGAPEAEPETPQEPGEPETAQEPSEAPEAPEAPDQPSGLTEAEAEKIIKDAGRDWANFRTRTIARWQGEGQYLHDCPLCMDNHKGLVDIRHAGKYPRGIVNNVMGFLGMAREIDYKQSAKHNACSFCNANGKVATGSQVPEFTTVTCPECHGFGYTPPPTTGSTAGGNGTGDGASVTVLPTDIEHGEIDNWDEPKVLPDGRLNPNFGKQPSHKVLVEPYGITAGLSSRELVDA